MARDYSKQLAWRLLASASVFIAPLALRSLVAAVSATPRSMPP